MVQDETEPNGMSDCVWVVAFDPVLFVQHTVHALHLGRVCLQSLFIAEFIFYDWITEPEMKICMSELENLFIKM